MVDGTGADRHGWHLPVEAFDRVFNGNTGIFWGDAFLLKLTLP